MAENGNGTTKGFVYGLLAGSAIGAVLALLYAPKTGRELRANIKSKTDELINNAEDAIEKARGKLPEISTEARKRSEQIISDAKNKADSLLQDADRVLNNVKQRSTAILEESIKVKEAVKAGMDAYKQERNRT